MRRALGDHLQRYAREFRRRNPEIKDQVATVRTALTTADKIDAMFVHEHQLVHILLHGCYTKLVPIVSASLQAFHFLVSHQLLVDADLHLVVQVLFELTDSSMRLVEIGSTALECCLCSKLLVGTSLGKAIGVCIRQRCALWQMHRLIALVIDRTVVQAKVGYTDVDELSSLSISLESPPVHSMDQARGDAFAFVKDLVLMSLRRRRPQWLHRVKRVPILLTLDVLAYTLTHQPNLFLMNAYFEKLLTTKVFTLISDCLDNAIAGRYRGSKSGQLMVEKAQEAESYLPGSEDEDEDTETEDNAQEDTEHDFTTADSIYLRLVIICDHLVRNFANIDRFKASCSSLLERLLRSLTKANRNEKAITLKAWSNLLSTCCASWPDREDVEFVFFPQYLTEVISWLCSELNICQKGVNIDNPLWMQPPSESQVGVSAVYNDAVVAFRKGATDVPIRETAMVTAIEWNSSKQCTQFDAADYLYIVLMTTKSFLISLNSCSSDASGTGISSKLTRLVSIASAAGTSVLGDMVQNCVHRQTDQTLILTLETTLELSGRAGHEDVCAAIVFIHTSVINQCLDQVQAIVSEQTTGVFVVRESVSDISHRIAQFGISLLHLASTYSTFIGDNWAEVCNVIFRLNSMFDFPYFKASLHYDCHPLSISMESSGSTMASMVSLVCEETTDVRRDLEVEIDNFTRNSSCYPTEVLCRILRSLFSNMKDQIATVGSSEITPEEAMEYDCLISFTIGKVSELAIYNLERFYAFGGEWLESFIGIFFATIQTEVKPARQCFYSIVDRLAFGLDAGTGRVEQSDQVENSLVTALYHFELVDRAELMQLQINCISRLVERYAHFPPDQCHHKSLVAIPELLRRHNNLQYRDNIESAFVVFQDFAKSPAIGDGRVRRQCCERSLDLSISFLNQRLSPNTAVAMPDAMRYIYKVIREGDLDKDADFERVLLDHVRQLEAFCRDDRSDVRREAAYLFFDILRGEEIRSSTQLFSSLVEEVVVVGLAAILIDLKETRDDQQRIDTYSNYILNVTNIVLLRYAEEKHRADLVSCDLWRQILFHLRTAMSLAIDPIAYAVLYCLRILSQGTGGGVAVDEELINFRRMLWCHAMELSSNAVEQEKVAEVLLPDTLHFLEEIFLTQFLSLSVSDISQVCDLVFKLVRDRAADADTAQTNGDVRKERRLLALVETVTWQLLNSGDYGHEEMACELLFRLANISINFAASIVDPPNGREKKSSTNTWPLGCYQSYQKQAFCLMKEAADSRINVSRGGRHSVWLLRCLRICEKANRGQYTCTHLGTWRAVHACFSLAIDALMKSDLQVGDHEAEIALAAEYEKALRNYLFSTEKSSRFISSADFLEHQNLELDVLNKIQNFIIDRPENTSNCDSRRGSVSANARPALRSHLTNSCITDLANISRTPAADVLLSSDRAGPSMVQEFFDSRQWRFQASCIRMLIFLMNWSLDQPKRMKPECQVNILLCFKEYAIEALVKFKERLETRGYEPLPSVVYFEINTLLATIKNMLNAASMDGNRRQAVVEIYPYLVDVILSCKGRVLADILDVLHAFKAIMQPGEAKK